ncbi:hypothetical protein ACNKHU_27320 [Shigella flexneri]
MSWRWKPGFRRRADVVQGYGATVGDVLVRHHDDGCRVVHWRYGYWAQHHEMVG